MNMRRVMSALCVICAALAVGNPSRSGAQTVPTPEARAARVEQGLLPGIVIAGRPAKTLAARMAELETPGVSVAVSNRALQGRSKVLTPATARQMVAVQKGNYGLGLSIEGAGTSAAFGHGGANAGFKCQMTAFIESGRGAVVMTNGDQGFDLVEEHELEFVTGPDGVVLHMLIDRQQKAPRLSQPPAMAPSTT